MFKRLGWLALSFLLVLPVQSSVAQSTASENVIGYLSTSCPTTTPCFIQYGPNAFGSTTVITGPLGSQASANSVSVTLPTDQTQTHAGVVGISAYITDPATGLPISYANPTSVAGPTANGSAAANPPVLMGGTANGTGTGNVENVKVDTSGDIFANIAQFGGSAVVTGTGASGSGIPRVTVSNDSVVGLAAGSNLIGTVSSDPCSGQTKLTADFEGTATGTIISAVSAKKAYICSVTIVSAAANNVSLIEGTASGCTTGSPSADYLNNATTASTGASFAANGGVSAGNGTGTIAVNATANQNTCVSINSASQVNVHVSYVQQ